ncbi:TetR/AcrR family transcriptional regulator C-terminal domain-containing protein [Nocardia sp. NPDC051570]|uniref:TetR/AcrR family transcriptional regulator C-terminal domain-containing protein n=1 Tax=Nocardia sp. NPDC051570 TaxID=3364324 RepID=UPI003797F555
MGPSIDLTSQDVGADQSAGDAHTAVGGGAVRGIADQDHAPLGPRIRPHLQDLLGVEALGRPHAVEESVGLPSRVEESLGPEPLLMRRDGAGLHAGTRPAATDLDRLGHKVAFLIASGLPERDAQLAMLAAGRFTVGAVLEEQADLGVDHAVDIPRIDHETAFEAGLAFIVDGVAHRVEHDSPGRA